MKTGILYFRPENSSKTGLLSHKRHQASYIIILNNTPSPLLLWNIIGFRSFIQNTTFYRFFDQKPVYCILCKIFMTSHLCACKNWWWLNFVHAVDMMRDAMGKFFPVQKHTVSSFGKNWRRANIWKSGVVLSGNENSPEIMIEYNHRFYHKQISICR